MFQFLKRRSLRPPGRVVDADGFEIESDVDLASTLRTGDFNDEKPVTAPSGTPIVELVARERGRAQRQSWTSAGVRAGLPSAVTAAGLKFEADQHRKLAAELVDQAEQETRRNSAKIQFLQSFVIGHPKRALIYYMTLLVMFLADISSMFAGLRAIGDEYLPAVTFSLGVGAATVSIGRWLGTQLRKFGLGRSMRAAFQAQDAYVATLTTRGDVDGNDPIVKSAWLRAEYAWLASSNLLILVVSAAAALTASAMLAVAVGGLRSQVGIFTFGEAFTAFGLMAVVFTLASTGAAFLFRDPAADMIAALLKLQAKLHATALNAANASVIREHAAAHHEATGQRAIHAGLGNTALGHHAASALIAQLENPALYGTHREESPVEPTVTVPQDVEPVEPVMVLGDLSLTDFTSDTTSIANGSHTNGHRA